MEKYTGYEDDLVHLSKVIVEKKQAIYERTKLEEAKQALKTAEEEQAFREFIKEAVKEALTEILNEQGLLRL